MIREDCADADVGPSVRIRHKTHFLMRGSTRHCPRHMPLWKSKKMNCIWIPFFIYSYVSYDVFTIYCGRMEEYMRFNIALDKMLFFN